MTESGNGARGKLLRAGLEPGADGYNAGYAEQLYERELRAAGVVPPSLAEAISGAVPPSAAGALLELGPEQLHVAAAAGALVEALRTQGHLAVPLDPLGTPPPGHPALDPAFHGISEADLQLVPAAALGLDEMGTTAADAIGRLRAIYCGRIGYELDHMDDTAQWNWLVSYIESARHADPLDEHGKKHLLRILTEVEGLERYLQRAYLGQKRFSIEGLDMLVPMIRRIIRRSALGGTRKFLIGMAHRGRLNVLAHIIGFSYEDILAEFEGRSGQGIQTAIAELGTGDVKYHVGAHELVRSPVGELEISLAPNPSHLEHVNPVVQGMARAARERVARDSGTPVAAEDESALDAFGTSVLPILVHGDAAFMGQGIVAETLNLGRLRGYENGGTIHIVANNQLGFTTDPEDTRSTRYASDLALAFRLPIVHVNADDPEACLSAIQLAIDYRTEFGRDVVVDLVGYRRWGHNEGDEPAYTQPVMYEKIRAHPSVRELWVARLVADGVLTGEEADAMAAEISRRLDEARERVKQGGESPAEEEVSAPTAGATIGIGMEIERSRPRAFDGLTEETGAEETPTGVPLEELSRLNDGIHARPEGFHLHPKLARQLERRKAAFPDALDWAHAETLAFASLVAGGVPVRLSGEDSERGTFSQRHLVFHDVETGNVYTPLKHLVPGQAHFQVWNSPLSEAAVLGFEYGYSTVATETLVLWEAQFGDFANVAQAIIDQFIAAGRAKWGQECRLVLLLPHGYEGQGPEHSSARLERCLDLAAEDNLRIANVTTPAQYFHLLRLQALRPARRPLVLLTPKSLLRHPAARSAASELAAGRFRPVLPGSRGGADVEDVRRLVLCSGKLYYDLVGSEEWKEAAATDVVRVELLYPFPADALRTAIESYPRLSEIVWAQEEPRNMGAWRYLSVQLRDLAAGRPVRYVGRPERASPAEGYAAAHAREQAAIVASALRE